MAGLEMLASPVSGGKLRLNLIRSLNYKSIFLPDSDHLKARVTLSLRGNLWHEMR